MRRVRNHQAVCVADTAAAADRAPLALRLRMAWCAVSLVAAALLAAPAARADESALGYADVKQQYRSSETWLLDRSGQRLQRVRTDYHVRRGDWIDLQDMSPALLQAIVLSEDQNFYQHSGVDWSAVSAAAWGNLWNERTRGASTITMQLAGLLDANLHPQTTGRRSWMQKWDQALLARKLEQSWSKSEILEAYLNLVPLRGELVGLDALSLSLFAKKPFALDARESAVAVALVRAPNASVATVARRACLALQQAQSPWGNDCKAIAFYTQAALQRRNFAPLDGPAAHFSRYALRQYRQAHAESGSGGAPATEAAAELALVQEGSAAAVPLPAHIQTTLNGPLQAFVVKTLQQHLQEITAQNVQDGAVLVLDNATGDVLAWVGSSGRQLSRAAEVDAVVALRQPGSTLKPFLYAQAIAQKRLTAASLLDDSPARIPTAHGLYVPQNYDLSFKGWVSVRLALASSLNIPAVRALVMVSPEAFAEQLRALGLPLTEPAGYYGYSLALGGVDVSLLSLTNAYRAMANGGQLRPVRALREQAVVQEGPQALDAGASFIISDILSDRYARATTFGTDSHLATRFWSAVKTGTSKDMRDNWAMGYTSRYTIGVWVGNADGSPMHDVSGVSGAAPVWAAIANYLQTVSASHAPTAPVGVIRETVTYSAPPGVLLEAGRSEWFLPGTVQTAFILDAKNTDREADAQGAQGAQGGQGRPVSEAATGAVGRILQPASGTILALDPDIPPANQLLRIRSNTARGAWFINGQPVSLRERGRSPNGASAQNPQDWFWIPQPGRFVFELRQMGTGQVLDTAHIEVRGAEFIVQDPSRAPTPP